MDGIIVSSHILLDIRRHMKYYIYFVFISISQSLTLKVNLKLFSSLNLTQDRYITDDYSWLDIRTKIFLYNILFLPNQEGFTFLVIWQDFDKQPKISDCLKNVLVLFHWFGCFPKHIYLFKTNMILILAFYSEDPACQYGLSFLNLFSFKSINAMHCYRTT